MAERSKLAFFTGRSLLVGNLLAIFASILFCSMGGELSKVFVGLLVSTTLVLATVSRHSAVG